MRSLYFIVFLLLALQPKIEAQSESSTQSLFQYFTSIQDSIPLIVLDTDSKKLIRRKLQEDYQKATLVFKDNQGNDLNLSAKVRARGNMRKQVCYFPPLKINLKKKGLKDAGFDTADKLKLVLQCWSNKKGYLQLHREQLLYQMQEIVGPFSYRTCLVRVKLADQDKEPYFAFLIEDEDEFSERLSGPIVEKGQLRSSLIDRDAYLRMCFFQYLILNTDWYMHNRHNLELVRPAGYELFCPVPYDFDYAGLVDAHYAVPHPSRNIKSVKQPCYLCEDVSLEEASQMAEFFLEKKKELYQVVEDYPHLEQKEKSNFTDRLDTFFREIENEKVLRRKFVNKD